MIQRAISWLALRAAALFLALAVLAGIAFRPSLAEAETRDVSSSHKGRHYGLPNAVIRTSADCQEEENGTVREFCFDLDDDLLFVCEPSDSPCGSAGGGNWTGVSSGSVATPPNVDDAGGQVSAVVENNATNATTTGVKVLEVTGLPAGEYIAEFFIYSNTDNASSGSSWGVFSLYATQQFCRLEYPSTGTTAATGVIDNDGDGQLMESSFTQAQTTTAPDMVIAGYADTGGANGMQITCRFNATSADSTIELWFASENTDTITVIAGSSVVVTRTQ